MTSWRQWRNHYGRHCCYSSILRVIYCFARFSFRSLKFSFWGHSALFFFVWSLHECSGKTMTALNKVYEQLWSYRSVNAASWQCRTFPPPTKYKHDHTGGNHHVQDLHKPAMILCMGRLFQTVGWRTVTVKLEREIGMNFVTQCNQNECRGPKMHVDYNIPSKFEYVSPYLGSYECSPESVHHNGSCITHTNISIS